MWKCFNCGASLPFLCKCKTRARKKTESVVEKLYKAIKKKYDTIKFEINISSSIRGDKEFEELELLISNLLDRNHDTVSATIYDENYAVIRVNYN